MTYIVLAVPERALAVFPRLTPLDEGERAEPPRAIGVRRAEPRRWIERASQLERVTVCGVVIDRRVGASASAGTGDDIRFGRMEVAARRIDAQRPTRLAKLFPGGQAEGMTQNGADDALRIGDCGLRPG